MTQQEMAEVMRDLHNEEESSDDSIEEAFMGVQANLRYVAGDVRQNAHSPNMTQNSIRGARRELARLWLFSGSGNLNDLYEHEDQMRTAGQQEYAHEEDNAFRNFEGIADLLDLRREQVLLVYLMKHIDGIKAWVDGHRSQREDVSGRIVDARVYLALLYGMIEQSKG